MPLDDRAATEPRRPPPGRQSPPTSAGPGRPQRLDPAATLPEGPDAPADPEAVARAIVLRKLTTAARTRAQLEDDLRGRTVPGEVAKRVLDRFAEVGLVDDRAFAAGWVRPRHATRGLSRRALAQELRRRGVADDLAAEAIATIGEGDERAAASALVAKRIPSLRGQDRSVKTRRLLAMLARRGYSSSLAIAVVGAALSGSPATDTGTEVSRQPATEG